MRLSREKELAFIASGRIKLPAPKSVPEHLRRHLVDNWEPATPAPKRKPAHTPGKMNKTEMRYAGMLQAQGYRYKFETLKFRLAKNTWFTPDFVVFIDDSNPEMHEVKGPFIREDAWQKFKIAREMYSEFTWKLFQDINGEWIEK